MAEGVFITIESATIFLVWEKRTLFLLRVSDAQLSILLHGCKCTRDAKLFGICLLS
jgi:hypothetical protein